jgi:hypothetical protein
MYGFENLCLTLREEHRRRVFENRVLIFLAKGGGGRRIMDKAA